jgi:hypothetical protein
MPGQFLLLVAVQWEAGVMSLFPQLHKYTVLWRVVFTTLSGAKIT